MASSRDCFGRRVCFVLLCLATLHLMATALGGGSPWWSLGVTDCALSSGGCPSCGALSNSTLLTTQQFTKCTRDQQTIRAVSRGARNAIIQCQNTFANRKWNCSTFFGNHLFGRFIDAGTRETAVLNAYFSIGAISALAIACREQRLVDCPCIAAPAFTNDTVTIFNVCSDNLDWAVEFAIDFIITSQGIDIDSSSLSLSDSVGVHNVDLGKDLLQDEGVRKVCKCHGISGTCTAQTCYDAAKSVEELSETLLIKYLGAVQVEMQENELVGMDGEMFDASTLIYKELTPDLCTPNPGEGILGTKERQCSPNLDADDYCGNVCCGGRFRTVQYQVPDEQCHFVWCCRIECDIVGIKTITEYLCRE